MRGPLSRKQASLLIYYVCTLYKYTLCYVIFIFGHIRCSLHITHNCTHNTIIKLQYYKIIVNTFFTVIGQVCAGENDFLCHSSRSCFHHFSCIQMSAAPLNSFEERQSSPHLSDYRVLSVSLTASFLPQH